MRKFDINEDPHRRFNPLLNEWVLVSPHRAKRPWQGQKENVANDDRPEYDPTCYLCPGNVRANGEINTQYSSSFVFENDFSKKIAAKLILLKPLNDFLKRGLETEE